MPKTGNTGSIVFATSGIVLSFTKIGEWQATRGKLDTSHLGTTNFKRQTVDDLADPGEIEIEAWFDPTKDLADINEGAETITVTYPLEAPPGTPATLAGTGFLMMLSLPELVNGAVSKQKVKICFDGFTGPAFTKET